MLKMTERSEPERRCRVATVKHVERVCQQDLGDDRGAASAV